jgi:hypothetical protein
MRADLKELLSREAQRVHPSPAPIDAVLTDVQTRVRHRRMGATAVAAALAVLAVAGPWAVGWIGEGSTVGRPADAVPSDPSWGPYRVGDTIYLGDQAELTNKHLADPMAEVPRGVVYSTATGKIRLLTTEGEHRQIGSGATMYPALASNPATGWVTWLENGPGRHRGEIVVYDTTVGRFGMEVDRLPVSKDGPRNCFRPRIANPGPFAIDGSAVYYCTGKGDFVWHPTEADTEPKQILPVEGDPSTSDDYLLDVRAGVQVVARYGDGHPTTAIMPVGQTTPTTTIEHELIGGFLSRDGRFVAAPLDEPMQVYDSSTGEQTTPDYSAGQGNRVPLAMTFTDDGGVALALIHPERGTTNIVTCSLPEGACEMELQDLDGGVFFANQRHQ